MLLSVYGGVGSGKSTVCLILKEKYDAYILEADKVAHVLYKKGQAGYKTVLKIFGHKVLNSNGEIDRKALAELLYSDKKKKKKLEMKIHPMVHSYCKRKIAELQDKYPERIIVYEAAIISHHLFFFDSVWYVKADREKRFERTEKTRNYTREKFDTIVNSQKPDDYFERLSDIVIDNNGNLQELEKKVDEALKHCQR